MKKNILEVEGLTVTTESGRELVKNISFSVREGEIVVLLGQSGSGKTMTCMAVLDMLPSGVVKSGGSVSIGGKSFTPDMRGSAAGIVMQAPASCFDPVFTMRTQFTDILKSNGKDEYCNDDSLCRMIADVGLSSPHEILKSYPFQLSGGMLQRLMISLTLYLETPLIITDEPTSDLDLPAQAEILDMITAIDRKTKGILMVTHDLSAALRTADRVIVMHEGKLADCFDINDIYADSRHSCTKNLIAANSSLRENMWGINFKNGGANHA